jgi:2-keto-4-pentenoate hydratase
MVEQRFLMAGGKLAEAWLRAGVVDDLARDQYPATRAEAYAIQDAMAEAIGETVAGWKVGATSPKMRELDGHDDVIPGRLFASTTTIGTTVELPADRYIDARAETEFAFRLTADVPPRENLWTVADLAPITVFHPAVEIIGNRYPKGAGVRKVGTLETIADNGGGIGFVFGAQLEDWRDIDFRNHVIKLTVDGGEPAENFLGDMRCVPIQALADLVNHLGDRGIGLKAGDFVSTGAATVPQKVSRGSHVVADFGMLGEIDIRFT